MNSIQTNVRAFMLAGKQVVNDRPCIIPLETRIARAQWLLSECLETIAGFGVQLSIPGWVGEVNDDAFEFHQGEAVDLVELADGIADVVYIAEGTACAFGIDTEIIHTLVHAANMRKLAEGSYVRPDGKIIKPLNWVPPNEEIRANLKAQCLQ